MWNSSWPKKIDNIYFTKNINCDIKNLDFVIPKKSLLVVADSCLMNINPIKRIKNRSEPLSTVWKIYEN